MVKINDSFHVGEQRFVCVGEKPYVSKVKQKASILSVWLTACPGCGRNFQFELPASFPVGIRGIRRRCDNCKAPGKPVDTHTIRQRVADAWRPDAWRAIRDAAVDMDAYGEEADESFTAADMARHLADASLEAGIRARLNLDKPHASTRVGQLLMEMEKRRLAQRVPGGAGRWVVTDLDDSYYDIAPSVVERRSAPVSSAGVPPAQKPVEMSPFDNKDPRFMIVISETVVKPNARLLEFLWDVASRAAQVANGFFDLEGFRAALGKPARDMEAFYWARIVVSSNDWVNGFIGILLGQDWIQAAGTGYILTRR